MTDSRNIKDGKMNESFRIYGDFPKPDDNVWEAEIVQSLKGKTPESLVTSTYEGIQARPIYNYADVSGIIGKACRYPGVYPFDRGSTAAGYKSAHWHIAQEFGYPDASAFNQALKSDLEQGQNAVVLNLDYASSLQIDPTGAKEDEIGYKGTSICHLKDLEKALDGIDLTKYPVYIKNGSDTLPIASFLAALTEKKGIKNLTGGLLIDPLAWLEENGSLPYSIEDLFRRQSELLKWGIKNQPEYRFINADASLYNESGANAVQEIAFVLAKGVEYLRGMQSNALPAGEIAKRMIFSFSTGTNFFMEIAKFRAARMLWSKITKEFGYGEKSRQMFIYAGTCKWNKSKLDAHTNLLRATSETLSAILGGCNAINTGNFDASFGLPNEFSRRISRNIQVILHEECNLTDTVDPAAGSWYLESLVSELSGKAWDLFRSIEKEGGYLKAFEKGIMNTEIESVKNKRVKNLFTRKDVLVGINKYPNLNEKHIETEEFDIIGFARTRSLETASYIMNRDRGNIESALNKISSDNGSLFENLAAAAKSGATIGELADRMPSNCIITSENRITPENLTTGFEYLRANAQAYRVHFGKFPEIFFASMGPVKQHKARVDFSMDYFRVGGFDPVYSKGFDSIDEAVEVFVKSGSKAAVICSTDDTYDEIVPEFVAKAKAAVKDAVIILAGYPKEKVEEYKKAGIDDFIHVKSNIFETLKNLQKAIGLIS